MGLKLRARVSKEVIDDASKSNYFIMIKMQQLKIEVVCANKFSTFNPRDLFV